MKYVTDETFDAVQVYIDFIANKVPVQGLHSEVVEDRVKTPWPDCYGTVDYLAYVVDPNGFDPNTLYVVDYKHGAGVKVDAYRNPQLACYAIGAVQEYPDAERIICVIVQPRCDIGEPITTWEMDRHELGNWEMIIGNSIRAAESDVKHFEAGDHCRFCKAKAICPELHDQAIEIAKSDFDDPIEAVPGLTGDQVADILSKAKTIKLFLTAVEEHAQGLLNRGIDVPGYKLVGKQGNRRWKDPEDIIRRLKNKRVKRAHWLDERLKSPAQIEKTLGKDWVAQWTERPKTGTTVAPLKDKREAITPALNAFDEVEGEHDEKENTK
jgi:hypothetical protein